MPRGWGAGMVGNRGWVALFFTASQAAHRTYPSIAPHLSSPASALTDTAHG